MSHNQLNFNNFPVFGKNIVSESYFLNKKIKKEYLFPVDNCDDFFETLQGRLKATNFKDKINDSSILADLPICKTVIKTANILGEYYAKTRHIKYYNQTPEILEITKIHERFHAAHHLQEDQNGNIWDDFEKASTFHLELLAQLFTWIYIRDHKSNLTQVFRDLNSKQPIIYQTYKIFEHYDSQQAEGLYWDVRNIKTKATTKVLRCLDTLSNLFLIQNTKIMSTSKIIPSTKLRALYQSLNTLHLSTDTQKCIMLDLLRKDNHQGLVKLFDESYKHIESAYDNVNEPILSLNSKRKPILGKTSIKSTNDVIFHFLSNNKNVCVAPSMYSFEYIEREVSPLRTTHAIYSNNLPAKSSGTGGLDFIGWNTSRNLPVLGEIKVKEDQNPFYALIQLLTYLSEISTPNQIDRINNYKHFGTANCLSSNTKFYLYIISCRQLNPKKKYDLLLPSTKALAKNLSAKINIIEDIIFFHLDLNTKVITQE